MEHNLKNSFEHKYLEQARLYAEKVEKITDLYKDKV